jgi:hypothetical protein
MAKVKLRNPTMNSDRTYLDQSRNEGLVLEFRYMGSKENTDQSGKLRPKSVSFLAMLKSMSDQYESSWESEDVWGRMDGIYNYQNTKRKYNLTWDIPAWNLAEARDNLRNVGLLANFLYPGVSSKLFTKTDSNGNSFKSHITDIKSPPILTLKYGNLIRDVNTNGGLYGFIDGGFSVNMKLEQGVFVEKAYEGDSATISISEIEGYNFQKDKLNFYPKMIELTISYRVLHSHKLGWDVETNQLDDRSIDAFPYGFDRNLIVTNTGDGGFTDTGEQQSLENQTRSFDSDFQAMTEDPIQQNQSIGDGAAIQSQRNNATVEKQQSEALGISDPRWNNVRRGP